MYQLVKARYRTDRRAGRWLEADLTAVPVTTLATQYGEVWLYITYAGLPEPKALRVDRVIAWLSGVGPTVTVQQWLTGLGNRSLPFEANLPNPTPRYVQYVQAWHAGYDIQPIARNGTVDSLGSKFDKEDLLLTHPSFTPEHIATHALVTVNGYFHLCDHSPAGVRVYDGNRSLRKHNDNQVGIHSFEAIGALQYCPIVPQMLSKQNENARFYDATYLTIPETYDLDNKTVLLVAGGHLQVLDRTYQRVGDRTWRLQVAPLMHPDRWFEARRYLNLDSLGIEQYQPNPSLIAVSRLQHDDTVRGYLTLSQSFLALVDTTTFFHELLPLESLGITGRYIDEADLKLPIMGAYGKMLEYHTIYEEPYYVYCCSENLRHNYDLARRKWHTFPAIDAGRYPASPVHHSGAWFRVMGTEA